VPGPAPAASPRFQTPSSTPVPGPRPAPAPDPIATPGPVATSEPIATPAPAVTVAALIEEFIDVTGAGRSVRRSLRDHVAPELGGMRIDDVHRRDVQSLIDGLDADGMPPSQIRPVANAVRTMYAHAIAEGYVARNPADGMLIPEDGGDYEPLALLPERILSLVLRIVVVLFVIFALVTITGSA
jgi:hypothetical protein